MSFENNMPKIETLRDFEMNQMFNKKEKLTGEEKIKKIGIDLDYKDVEAVEKVLKIAKEYGRVYRLSETKNGFHIYIELQQEVTLKQSFWIRFFIGDDYMRLLYDLLRFTSGVTLDRIDILFDSKTKIDFKNRKLSLYPSLKKESDSN